MSYESDLIERIGDLYPLSKRKLLCNNCKLDTNQYRKFGPHFRYVNEELDNGTDLNEWVHVYNLWECAGCNEITLEILSGEGWLVDPNFDILDYLEKTNISDNEIKELIKKEVNNIEKARIHGFVSNLYPYRSKEKIEVKTFIGLPNKLFQIYCETVKAYNNGLNILCTIGLRSLLQGICIDRGAPKNKNLAEQIEYLKGDFPENIVNELHEFRFMGNESTHDLESSPLSKLLLAITVIESLLTFLYKLQIDVSILSSMRKGLYTND